MTSACIIPFYNLGIHVKICPKGMEYLDGGWEVIDRVRVSEARSKPFFNSKTLHQPTMDAFLAIQLLQIAGVALRASHNQLFCYIINVFHYAKNRLFTLPNLTLLTYSLKLLPPILLNENSNLFIGLFGSLLPNFVLISSKSNQILQVCCYGPRMVYFALIWHDLHH